MLALGGLVTVAVLQRAAPTVNPLSADAAFEQAVALCQQRASGWRSVLRTPLNPQVLDLLGQAFDEDFERVQSTSIRVEPLPCLQPLEDADGYGLLGKRLLELPKRPHRACVDGACADRCSRVQHADFATAHECDSLRTLANSMLPPPEEEGESCFYLIEASERAQEERAPQPAGASWHGFV